MSEKNRQALVVGIERYLKPGYSLPGVAELATQLAEKLRRCGFKVILLPKDSTGDKIAQDQSVTAKELKEAIVQLFNPNTQSPPDTVLFFFLGHGKRDEAMNEGHLVTSDADFGTGHYGVPLANLVNQLWKSSISEQLVWLDCCHSGELLNRLRKGKVRAGKNRCVITSTTDYEKTPAEGKLTRSLLEVLERVKDSEALIRELEVISKGLPSQRFQFLPAEKRGKAIRLGGEEIYPEKAPAKASTPLVEAPAKASSPLVVENVNDRKGTVFTFETILVDSRGQEIKREPGQARQVVINLGKGVALEMVHIPGGTFLMGAAPNEAGARTSEFPQHPVTLQSFWMGKYPVTQAQWQAIMGNNPSYFKGENRPVERVSWNDAKVFCDNLSQRTGQTFRLPSEAEWEYACRAGTTTPFSVGETITPDLVNYDGNYPYGEALKGKYRAETTPVDNFLPNAFGLYDMHGNVWEWCEDVWHDNYDGAPKDGSAWGVKKEKGFLSSLFGKEEKEESYRLLRGGSWNYNAVWCRAALRFNLTPDYRTMTLACVSFCVLCGLCNSFYCRTLALYPLSFYPLALLEVGN